MQRLSVIHRIIMGIGDEDPRSQHAETLLFGGHL